MNQQKLARQQRVYLRLIEERQAAKINEDLCKKEKEHDTCKDQCTMCNSHTNKNTLSSIKTLEGKGVHTSLGKGVYEEE